MRARAYALLAAVVLAAAGCSSAESLPVVTGVLTVDGKPVPSGNVTFYPDAAKGNSSQHQPTGSINPDGTYEVFVTGGRKGAPAGWYKVVVYAVDDPWPGKPNKYFTSKSYADVKTTPLSVEVVGAPEPGRYDFKLKR